MAKKYYLADVVILIRKINETKDIMSDQELIRDAHALVRLLRRDILSQTGKTRVQAKRLPGQTLLGQRATETFRLLKAFYRRNKKKPSGNSGTQ